MRLPQIDNGKPLKWHRHHSHAFIGSRLGTHLVIPISLCRLLRSWTSPLSSPFRCFWQPTSATRWPRFIAPQSLNRQRIDIASRRDTVPSWSRFPSTGCSQARGAIPPRTARLLDTGEQLATTRHSTLPGLIRPGIPRGEIHHAPCTV